MSTEALKAYHVGEGSEGEQVIRFATNSAQARREGGNELNLTFEEVNFCRRAPWADAGVSIVASHMRLIGLTHMVAVKPGQHAILLPTKSRGTIAPCAIEAVVWEAASQNQGAYIIDTVKDTSLAATMIKESQFRPSFMDCFKPQENGKQITGLYYRMVLAAERVAKLHADFTSLAQYRAQGFVTSTAHGG